MQTTEEQLQTLYAHRKRPRWGFAILAWEGREQRHYQFQDGQLRTFKKGYYELLTEVDEPVDRALDIVRDLKAMLRIERGRRDSGATPKSLEHLVSFDDQLRLFTALYPAGFVDGAWVSEMRGEPGARRLKRHRDPAIEEARRKLGRDALDAWIASGDHRAVCEAAKTVLAGTDLAGSKDTAALRRLPEGEAPAFARALRDLLYGDDRYALRFTAFTGVLDRASSAARGQRVGWPLATALSALVHPNDHFAIKPSVARQQAQWIAPGMAYDANPNAELYKRLLAMADSVRRRLERAGHAPRDLLDVYDFMIATLRPKTRELLTAIEAKQEQDLAVAEARSELASPPGEQP